MNGADWIIILLVIAAAVLALRRIILDRKNGKACSCGCGGCSGKACSVKESKKHQKGKRQSPADQF